MIDYSLIKLIPANESHREFSYRVKKAAEGAYITEIFGWDEAKELNFHAQDWQMKRPSIITYRNQPIGTIYILEMNDFVQIGQFFILPEYENQGIGSHILRSILDKADRASLVAKLMCFRNNPAASLYRRMGFEATGTNGPFILMERKPEATHKTHSKYQAVIFDLFGTLVNIFSVQEYQQTLAEMIAILKAPHDEFVNVWRQTAGERSNGGFRTLEENIEYIGQELKINFSKNQVKRACRCRMDYVANAMTPKPDVLETLAQLKSSGYKIGLISNCSPEPPIIWPKTPFAPFFNTTIFSCSEGLRKPDPRIYMLAIEKLSVEPEDCLYIGDGDGNELTGAALVGMHPVLIRNPGENSINALRDDDYQGENWDGLVITSLKEVLNLLEE